MLKRSWLTEHGTLTRELLKKIDYAAIMWNKTKDSKYKDLWYKLIKEWANGSNNTKRRIVSISAINKADDGTYVFVGKSELYGPVRDSKNKTNNLRRQFKLICNE